MGEAADDEFDRMMGRWDHYDDIAEYQAGDYKWRTASGEVLSMWDMETTHLQNCLRFADFEKTRQINHVLKKRAGMITKPDPKTEYEQSYQDFLKRIGHG